MRANPKTADIAIGGETPAIAEIAVIAPAYRRLQPVRLEDNPRHDFLVAAK